VIRTNKKINILDNGIQNSLLKRKEVDDATAGHIVEGMADFDARLICEKENYNQYYFRNAAQEEVDIIIDRKLDLIPIEVKYSNTIDPADTENIRKFIEANKSGLSGVNYGIMITKDTFKIEDNLYYIPYWMFNIS